MSRRGCGLMLLALSLVAISCTGVPAASPQPTAPPITDPAGTSTSSTLTGSPSTTSGVNTSTTGLPTTVPAPETVWLPNVFAFGHQEAISELQELGFAVISYDVCSSSVARGEVRQVVSRDGDEEMELVGSNGVTDAGTSVPFGSTIEVKIGTGAACGVAVQYSPPTPFVPNVPVDGVGGSGCSPGPGALPDGEWFGFVAAVEDTSLEFDLACYMVCESCDEGAPALWIVNDNPRSRTVPVSPGAEVHIEIVPGRNGDVWTYPQWQAEGPITDLPTEIWIYVNGGEASFIVQSLPLR
jgi:hypothetical protein